MCDGRAAEGAMFTVSFAGTHRIAATTHFGEIAFLSQIQVASQDGVLCEKGGTIFELFGFATPTFSRTWIFLQPVPAACQFLTDFYFNGNVNAIVLAANKFKYTKLGLHELGSYKVLYK